MCWVFSLTDCKIFSKLSPEHIHTRVQPQCFLDHLLQVLHALKVTKRGIACRIAKYLFQFSNSFLLYTQLIKNINSIQWWTYNTAVLCWWTHQLGSEQQCNGFGYKFIYCTLSSVITVINILQRTKTTVHNIWRISVLFTCCSWQLQHLNWSIVYVMCLFVVQQNSSLRKFRLVFWT
jgi:hypothetical protein